MRWWWLPHHHQPPPQLHLHPPPPAASTTFSPRGRWLAAPVSGSLVPRRNPVNLAVQAIRWHLLTRPAVQTNTPPRSSGRSAAPRSYLALVPASSRASSAAPWQCAGIPTRSWVQGLVASYAARARDRTNRKRMYSAKAGSRQFNITASCAPRHQVDVAFLMMRSVMACAPYLSAFIADLIPLSGWARASGLVCIHATGRVDQLLVLVVT